jgi:alkanesulfonate monooxygenase SsuD/methylene tetrahydromethanopterin reductase-like flavin-dependent oxidoreductase (luciferase family)
LGVPVGIAPELTEPAVLGSLVRAAEGVTRPPARPLAMLGWLAAATQRVGIGTSMLVLPYRDPVVVAKAAGTADWLSGGRLTLGVGAGWLRQEFEALGIPFAERGRADVDAYAEAGADEVVVSLAEDGGPAEVLHRWAGFAARAGLS